MMKKEMKKLLVFTVFGILFGMLVVGGVGAQEEYSLNHLSRDYSSGWYTLIDNNLVVNTDSYVIYSTTQGNWLPAPTITETLRLNVIGEKEELNSDPESGFKNKYRVYGNKKVGVKTKTWGEKALGSWCYDGSSYEVRMDRIDTFQRESDTSILINGISQTINLGDIYEVQKVTWFECDNGYAYSYLNITNVNSEYFDIEQAVWEYDEECDSAHTRIESYIECAPKTCAELGKECNIWDDGCGGILDCESCDTGEICQDGMCVLMSFCDDVDRIIKLYQSNNSHGALWNDSNYNWDICYSHIFGDFYTGDLGTVHDCTGSNKVVGLYDITNAHAEEPSLSNYLTDVCYGDLSCEADTTVGNTCTNGGEIVVRLYQENNSHLAEGDFADYPIKICCQVGAVPPTENLYWANMMGTKINTADLKDTVKLIVNLPGSEGKTIDFVVRKKETLLDIDWLWPDSTVAEITAIGFTTWKAGEKDDGTFSDGDYYFKATVEGTEYNSKDAQYQPYGELTVSAPEANSPPEAIITYPSINLPVEQRRFQNGTEIDFNIILIDVDDDLSAEWNFDDNNITKFNNCLTTNICNTSHTYYRWGSKIIYLTAKEMTRGREAYNYTKVFIYDAGINVFVNISSPEPDWVFEPGNRLIHFNASSSYVSNCSYDTNFCSGVLPSGASCYPTQVEDLYCFDYPKTGANGLGITDGKYVLWFDWMFSEGAGRYGNWSYYDVIGDDDYADVVDFRRAFYAPTRHWAKLKVGYDQR